MIKLLKQLFAKGDCPKCGWWIACDECSKRLDDIELELDCRK